MVRDFKSSITVHEWIDLPVKNAGDLRRIIDEQFDFSREHGIDISWYYSGGDCKPFIKFYLESGIDSLAPCEVAAGMDPVLLREKYGKKIKMLGGIDKRELSKGKKKIEREVMKKLPVIREGGYIPKMDHSVSSDISLENYTFHVNTLKGIYGMG